MLLILSTAVRYIAPLLLIFSIFLLFRGHNEPGGGFVGGLVAAAAYALTAIAFGVEKSKKMLKFPPIKIIATGILIALLSGLIAQLYKMNFMTGIWDDTELPIIGKLGTPLIFDIGVYLCVLGISLMIIFSLFEEEK